jgi:hypothetical protein
MDVLGTYDVAAVERWFSPVPRSDTRLPSSESEGEPRD